MDFLYYQVSKTQKLKFDPDITKVWPRYWTDITELNDITEFQ